MNTLPLVVTLATSPVEYGEMLKQMVLQATGVTDTPYHLAVVVNETLGNRIDEAERTSLEKAGYKFDTRVLESQLLRIAVENMEIKVSRFAILIEGRIRLGNFFFLGVQLEADLKTGVGTLNGFQFDRRTMG